MTTGGISQTSSPTSVDFNRLQCGESYAQTVTTSLTAQTQAGRRESESQHFSLKQMAVCLLRPFEVLGNWVNNLLGSKPTPQSDIKAANSTPEERVDIKQNGPAHKQNASQTHVIENSEADRTFEGISTEDIKRDVENLKPLIALLNTVDYYNKKTHEFGERMNSCRSEMTSTSNREKPHTDAMKKQWITQLSELKNEVTTELNSMIQANITALQTAKKLENITNENLNKFCSDIDIIVDVIHFSDEFIRTLAPDELAQIKSERKTLLNTTLDKEKIRNLTFTHLDSMKFSAGNLTEQGFNDLKAWGVKVVEFGNTLEAVFKKAGWPYKSQ